MKQALFDTLRQDTPSVWIELPPDAGRERSRFFFSRPVEIWQADRPEDVRGAVAAVEAAQRDGRYVAGFIAYEAAPAFDPALKTPPRGELPLAWFAAFAAPGATPPAPPAPPPVAPELLIAPGEYLSAVRRALDYIRAGDIYQVNYTVRARLAERVEPYALFRALGEAAPMPHAAFIDTGSAQVVSLSPELFLRRTDDVLETRPMKGTARRRPSWDEDEAARRALAADEKNRAENVMIVDLMRNDLGRVCRAGTVTVPELWRADRFPTVHQMTSLVRGRLRDGVSLFEILAATFPPGSVTGAPKIRACEIIAELEPVPRGIYCGSIGLFFPGGDFELNVAIRTLAFHPSAILGIGSGIVADSDPQDEWAETKLKYEFVTRRAVPFALYETIRYEAEGTFRDLLSHLRRLRRSCDYFGRPFPARKIFSELRALRKRLRRKPARVRLDLNGAEVSLKAEFENVSWPEPLTLMLADDAVDPDDVRLYHKTTLRPERYGWLERARALGAHECLFLNTRGELTEGALSNLLVKLDGEWLTPALGCGLLPGVGRTRLLRSGRCREAIMTLADLARAEEIRVVNAVRGEGVVTRVVDGNGTPLYAAG
ncbi:MAG: aminodeoxychorismate synthase component I [bacterium]|nr:aminodeoxychorismate synthase component I [bacterium]